VSLVSKVTDEKKIILSVVSFIKKYSRNYQ